MTITIEHSDPELRQQILVTKDDGREERVAFRCRTNGELGQCLLNGERVRGNARWQEDELVVELWVQHGTRELYLCDCWTLSPDAQTLCMEHRNDALAGQLTVLDRVAEFWPGRNG